MGFSKSDKTLLGLVTLTPAPFLILALTSSGASLRTNGFFSGAFILQTTSGLLTSELVLVFLYFVLAT